MNGMYRFYAHVVQNLVTVAGSVMLQSRVIFRLWKSGISIYKSHNGKVQK